MFLFGFSSEGREQNENNDGNDNNNNNEKGASFGSFVLLATCINSRCFYCFFFPLSLSFMLEEEIEVGWGGEEGKGRGW